MIKDKFCIELVFFVSPAINFGKNVAVKSKAYLLSKFIFRANNLLLLYDFKKKTPDKGLSGQL